MGAIEKLPVVSLAALDGNTVPSTDIFGYKTYIDIGSGTVLKLAWDTPLATNNRVDYYMLSIETYSSSGDTTYSVFNENIGNVNEFYINSSLISQIDQSRYQLKISLTAHSIYGSTYSNISNPVIVYIQKGCGFYIKVREGYTQPIMKRAIAFAQVPGQIPTVSYKALADVHGRLLTDSNGRQLYVKVSNQSRSIDGYSWNIMQDFYTKDTEGLWELSDIRYEVLTDEQGEIITDINNEPIYTL